jgi:hypothetical protein
VLAGGVVDVVREREDVAGRVDIRVAVVTASVVASHSLLLSGKDRHVALGVRALP